MISGPARTERRDRPASPGMRGDHERAAGSERISRPGKRTGFRSLMSPHQPDEGTDPARRRGHGFNAIGGTQVAARFTPSSRAARPDRLDRQTEPPVPTIARAEVGMNSHHILRSLVAIRRDDLLAAASHERLVRLARAGNSAAAGTRQAHRAHSAGRPGRTAAASESAALDSQLGYAEEAHCPDRLPEPAGRRR